ncbi:serpin family protein [Bradymonas sediminis]|uniref:Serpin family protein n=1 Tax=Bradymonas sediminis TaxID=1548548 RepID=A0A2Z4FMQ0_9DELT|nr:serpin family protein [Bradymonas sediminis]AWV90223.1 serpin family protein [Bradymonas sediminis]TDP75809.1 serpin B [Bradymonas sediminis]
MYRYSFQSRLGARLLTLLLAGSIAGGLIGCEDATQEDTKPEPTAPGEVRSDKQRVANPDVAQSARDALVAGNTEFALDLYKKIAEEDKNLFYSPFSISEALAMTYAGARGETASQMAETLHFNSKQGLVHPAFNWLDAHLMDLGETPVLEDSSPFELAVANSIWGQIDYAFETNFLDTLALNYGAGLNTLDFAAAPEQSRQTINGWVEAQTNDRIKDLIPEQMITTDTKMVLTNAIFFKASWLNPFQEEMTIEGDFTRRDGSTVSAQMMRQTTGFMHAQMDGFQAVSLPYDGGDVSMLVILPEDIEAFEAELDADTLADTVAAMESTTVHLTLPKFEYTLPLTLSEVLPELGMPLAFSDNADFSGMSTTSQLRIAEVVHKAFVAVDESGTEAAAATAVIMEDTAAPVDPIEFKADKPFIFMIRANQTGSLLFVGRVSDPSASN